MILLPVCLLLLIIACIVLVCRGPTEMYRPSSCIITMTTYMGYENRFAHINSVLGPLVATGQEVVVINEWDENYRMYIDYMAERYPQVRFIQKTKDDRGQPRSLNILVRDHLMHSDKKYWVHWEDTWVASGPLLPDLVRFMDNHPQITQLQATGDWKDIPRQHTIPLKDINILLPQHKYDKSVYEMNGVSLEKWPLFSLRPSINRLSFFQRHSHYFYFLEHPHLWPLLFEWEFGRVFLRNGGIKAVTQKPYAKKIKGQRSTYADMLTSGPRPEE